MAKPQILIIDNDEGFGTMLREGLSNSGYYEANCVHTAREAAVAIDKNSFDMVIVDMALTDVSPIKLVKGLRRAKNVTRKLSKPYFGIFLSLSSSIRMRCAAPSRSSY